MKEEEKTFKKKEKKKKEKKKKKRKKKRKGKLVKSTDSCAHIMQELLSSKFITMEEGVRSSPER